MVARCDEQFSETHPSDSSEHFAPDVGQEPAATEDEESAAHYVVQEELRRPEKQMHRSKNWGGSYLHERYQLPKLYC